MSTWPDTMKVGPIREWPDALTVSSARRQSPFRATLTASLMAIVNPYGVGLGGSGAGGGVMTDPTPEERERMALAISARRGSEMIWAEDQNTADALIAAGFGDVSAERERADKAERDAQTAEDQADTLASELAEYKARADAAAEDYTSVWQDRHALVAERDRLLARINAATAASRPPTKAEWSERVQAARERARAKGYDETHDREHGPVHLLMWAQDYLRRGRTDDAGGLIDSAMAVIMRPDAFTEDQPAATPEPPHLDPNPVICGLVAFQRHGFTHAPYWCGGQFAPREHDVNGKPYSERREDYP